MKDKTRTELSKITGCNQPCFYREFSQVGKEVIRTFDKHGMIFLWNLNRCKCVTPVIILIGYNIILANSEVIEEEEHYIYDFISFTSEVGGSLGLFLGFSFIMLFDYLAQTMIIVKKLFN